MRSEIKPCACPHCGGALNFVKADDGGVISELVIQPRGMTLTRRARPASFYACTRCEWCEEDR